VLAAGDGAQGLELVEAEEPDLIVLDLLMPKMDGFEMMERLRSFSSIPIIVLSARGADTDRIRGLQLGADDYLSKPFNPEELMARIEAVRRRLRPGQKRKIAETVRYGDVVIDFEQRKITIKGESRRLTRIEWLLLGELVQNAGRLMVYEELLTRVWGPEYRNDVHILRTWVSRLRRKLERDPRNPKLIRTIPKVGYVMEQPRARAGATVADNALP
jgi:two-component system KDP operon response regulator KdpE